MKLFDFRSKPEDYDYKTKPEPNPINRKEGWDVPDRENYYNESGFENDGSYSEIADTNEPAEEIGELMEKYGREEWELVNLMEQCETYLNKSGKGAQPLKNMDEVRNLAIFYREYLAAKSADGLPFSEAERKNVPEDKLKDLISLHEKLGDLNFELAELNKNKPLESEETPKNFESNSNIIYSTAEKNNSNDVSSYFLNLKELQKQKTLVQRKIDQIEEAVMSPTRPNKEKMLSGKPNDQWAGVPEFSAEELRVMEDSAKWLKNRRSPQPTFANGEKLNEAQVLESAQEYAGHEAWPKAMFSVQEFKGRRQLVYMERLGNKQIRYVHFSNDLPAGQYYFEVNAAAFFVDKKNPNFAVAPISLMVSTENPQRFLEKKEGGKRKAELREAV
ncbi:MAG: hypothetical protein NTX66_00085 [Candidatus Falkowbacteria bacterium]|nr:hypothetical protein [Candidatus Falkowbacteria bacterium]